jgi:carbonic anhydrase
VTSARCATSWAICLRREAARIEPHNEGHGKHEVGLFWIVDCGWLWHFSEPLFVPLMSSFERLFENNRKWSEAVRRSDPGFFEELAAQQAPQFLWIGCSDSRVSANEIVGLKPGEIFVHRNLANLVMHTDFNCLSVVQYAVEVLKVKHVILTGHYGCGGVQAVFRKAELGLIDNWLHSIALIAEKHRDQLGRIADSDGKLDRLCELNVIEQVRHLCTTSLVRNAWLRGQNLAVHGCIYGLKDGILQDLGVTVAGDAQAEAVCDGAVQQLAAGQCGRHQFGNEIAA